MSEWQTNTPKSFTLLPPPIMGKDMPTVNQNDIEAVNVRIMYQHQFLKTILLNNKAATPPSCHVPQAIILLRCVSYCDVHNTLM